MDYKRMSALINELQAMLRSNDRCWRITIDSLNQFTEVQIDRSELNAVEDAAGTLAKREIFTQDKDELCVCVDGVRYVTLEEVDRDGR